MYFALANGLSELNYEVQGDLIDMEKKVVNEYVKQGIELPYADVAKMTHDVTLKSQGEREDIKSEDDLVKVFRDAANKGKPMVAILKMKQEVWWNKKEYEGNEHGVAVVYDQKTDTLFYIDPFTGNKSTNLTRLITKPQRDGDEDFEFSIGANNGVSFFNIEEAPPVPGVQSINNR